MASNTPMILPKKVQEGIIQFHKQCFMTIPTQWNMRANMENIDRAYQREQDQTKDTIASKAFNTVGDSTKIQNPSIPVVAPVVESAVEYQTSVFLTGTPIFGVVSSPEFEDQALQLETVVDDQATRGAWVNEFIMAFRDGFKYNLAAMEVSWEAEVTAALETDVSFSTKNARPVEVIWEGNKIKRLDLYNTFFDPRVPPHLVHKLGEFAGYHELMSRVALKAYVAKLPTTMNLTEAFESGFMGASVATSAYGAYYIPTINPDRLLNADPRFTTNWMQWAQLSDSEQKVRYKNMYQVSTVYARIIPRDFDFKVPAPDTPQIWKFIIVNNQVIIYAERQTNAHGYLPVLIFQPTVDGLSFQTKSLATNVLPIQQINTALWASVIAARRRAISDRGLFDPSRVSEAHINNPNPAAKIPVRPAAFGKPLNEAYFPIPFRDEQSPIIMQESEKLFEFAYLIAGQNRSRQGLFTKGNKTMHEYADVMANANGRDQMCAITIESTLLTPLKEILKVNILQYQGGVSLYNRAQQRTVDIDPIALRKAVMQFKISDGLIPSDKLINADSFQAAMQALMGAPQLGQGYNITPMFSYLMKTQGADLSSFEKSPQQLAYEQASAQWQQTVQQLFAQAAKSGADLTKITWPPQPTPQQFGYTPQGDNVAPGAQSTGQPTQEAQQ